MALWREPAMKTKILSTLAAAVFLTVASSAFAGDVKTDYNHEANFDNIHTYAWGEMKTANPFYADRIKQEVDKDLQGRGWQLVQSGADVTIFAVGSIHNQQELETYYNGFGGGWGGGWGWRGWGPGGWGDTTTTVTNQKVGMLVVDMFNGNSKELMWRGSSDEDISKNTDKNTKNLDKDIDKMFEKFPPKK
jgi:hypothetical protein